MPKEIKGNLTGQRRRFAVVVARFNSFITDKLLEGALDCLMRHGVSDEDINVVWVPGAFEIPLVARTLAASAKHDAVIALGCVIRGATPHFDYVCSESASGVAQAALETGRPVINGILTTNTIEEAIERAGTKAGNKGADAAMAALEMVDLRGNH